MPYTPAPEPYEVPPRAAIVRPYLIAVERERERQRADRIRLGPAVLPDISKIGEMTEVPA